MGDPSSCARDIGCNDPVQADLVSSRLAHRLTRCRIRDDLSLLFFVTRRSGNLTSVHLMHLQRHSIFLCKLRRLALLLQGMGRRTLPACMVWSVIATSISLPMHSLRHDGLVVSRDLVDHLSPRLCLDHLGHRVHVVRRRTLVH